MCVGDGVGTAALPWLRGWPVPELELELELKLGRAPELELELELEGGALKASGLVLR